MHKELLATLAATKLAFSQLWGRNEKGNAVNVLAVDNFEVIDNPEEIEIGPFNAEIEITNDKLSELERLHHRTGLIRNHPTKGVWACNLWEIYPSIEAFPNDHNKTTEELLSMNCLDPVVFAGVVVVELFGVEPSAVPLHRHQQTSSSAGTTKNASPNTSKP